MVFEPVKMSCYHYHAYILFICLEAVHIIIALQLSHCDDLNL
jgi:hypothetical protein